MDDIIADEIIYNTYGDLYDMPIVRTTIDYQGVIYEPDIVPSEKIIKNFGGLIKGRIVFPGELGGGEVMYNLSSFMNKMPHGIIDKQEFGIGATSLELESNRNSIIVVPTKILAYSKAKKYPSCKYVGSSIGDFSTTSRTEICQYINEYIECKKFVVVADSLGKLMQVIGDSVYSDYFLMVDEIDVFQDDSSYRPALENVMDYYFKFPIKSRCLVTATVKEFSNPKLKYECKFDIMWQHPTMRNIILSYTNNINATIADEILKHCHEKILIAYNSIIQIKNVIDRLNAELQKECGILCSESSKKDVGGFYRELENNKLPEKICFMTCCYFSGIDIDDSYHLITVSNPHRTYQMISIDRMMQIYGRCRKSEGYNQILSDRIVFNDKKKNNIILHLTPEGSYKHYLIDKANKVLDLIRAADNISMGDKDLEDLFKIVKTAIKDKAKETLYQEALELIREDINGNYVPAYFSIDSLIEKEKMYNELYSNRDNLYKELIKKGHAVTLEISELANEDSLDANSERSIDANYDEYIKEAIGEIKELLQDGILDDEILKRKIKYSKKSKRIFYERFFKLYKYIDNNRLIDVLWDIRNENIKAFKSVNNAAMYWALEDGHSLKKDIYSLFFVRQKYTPTEIHSILAPKIKYHFHKTINGRASISFLKSVFEVKRMRCDYKILGRNPLKFSKHIEMIKKEENDLRRYFMI